MVGESKLVRICLFNGNRMVAKSKYRKLVMFLLN